MTPECLSERERVDKLGCVLPTAQLQVLVSLRLLESPLPSRKGGS